MSAKTEPKAGEVRGVIHVSFAVDPGDAEKVRAKLATSFLVVAPDPQFVAGPWQVPVANWVETDPANRLQSMKDAFGRWDNDDQPNILGSMVTGIVAELQGGDILPFQLLSFRFSIEVSRDKSAANSSRHLMFVAQKSRDYASKLIGIHGAETVVVTSEVIAPSQMVALRSDLARIRETRGTETPKMKGSLALAGPLGVESDEGFSHYLVAMNLHAVVAPLTSHAFGGPGWLVHVYERADPHNPPSWGSNALSLLDPVLSDWTSFVEQRPSGLPFLLASWHWFQSQRHGARSLLAQLSAEEGPIRRLGSVLNLRTWWRLRYNEDDARRRVHSLKILHAEYDASLSAFATSLRTEPAREVWIPPAGSVHKPGADTPGLIERMITDFLRQLRQTTSIATEGWEMAKAQRETHSSRVELALGIAVLLLTLVQVADLITRWST